MQINVNCIFQKTTTTAEQPFDNRNYNGTFCCFHSCGSEVLQDPLQPFPLLLFKLISSADKYYSDDY